MAVTLLVSPQEVTAQSQLGGNIDSEKLRIPIKTVQDLKLKPILGTSLYNRVEALFIAGNGVISLEPYKTLFEDYMVTTLVLYVAAKYTLQTPVEISNGGASSYSPANGSTSSRRDVVSQAQDIEHDAENYANLMVKYLDANTEVFPEYSEKIDGQPEANPDVYFCGIELGDRSRESLYLDKRGNWIR